MSPWAPPSWPKRGRASTRTVVFPSAHALSFVADRLLEDLHWGIPSAQTAADLPQTDIVHINDPAPMIRAAGNGVELAHMRFGFLAI